LPILEAVEENLITNAAETFDDCVKWARLKFEELFNMNIRKLTSQFPADHLTDEGLPFWSGTKRFPSPAQYDPENPHHSQFITAAAFLRARTFRITPEDDAPARAAAVDVGGWSRKVIEDQRLELERLIATLSPLIGTQRSLVAQTFEKDDDSNGHMDFIASAANIRATNYQIEPVDRLTLKGIAGNIIPAMATTTAMICGFVALEMYKVHSIVRKEIEEFQFATINLATNVYSLSCPPECPRKICPLNGLEYTLWTKWVIEGDLTLREFLQAVKEKYKLTVDMLSMDRQLIYDSFSPRLKSKSGPTLNKKITQIIADRRLPPLSPGQTMIFMHGAFADRIKPDLDSPPLVLKVK
jgi:ubiquitin-activating enzyme E1